MRKILLCLLMGLALQGSAQEFRQIMPEGRVWKGVDVHFTMEGGRYECPFTMTVAGDTIVGDRTMHKLRMTHQVPEGVNPGAWHDFCFVVFEDNGKVYEHGEEHYASEEIDGEWVDIYQPDYKVIDMSYRAGRNDWNYSWGRTVESEDTIRVNGIERRRLTFASGDEYRKGNEYWVDGIGPNRISWAYAGYPLPTCMDAFNYAYFTEIHDNGELVFTAKDFEVAPIKSTTAGIGAVANEEADVNGSLYDLSGRRVQKPVCGGIYVCGGKKVIYRK